MIMIIIIIIIVIIIMIMIMIMIMIITGGTVCLPCDTCRTTRPCHQLLGPLTGGHLDDYGDECYDDYDDSQLVTMMIMMMFMMYRLTHVVFTKEANNEPVVIFSLFRC